MRRRTGGVVDSAATRAVVEADHAEQLAALLDRLRRERPEVYEAMISVVAALVYKS